MDRRKILIVDDIPENLDVLRGVLRNEYDLYFASNGKRAIQTVTLQHPDLILLDIMMPEMDGFQVCAALKADSNTRDIPVIFITGRTDMESEIRAFSSGGVDFIQKPFNNQVVLARVRLHLELARHRDQLENLVYTRTRDLVEARDEAESANRAKSAFLNNMSHEIRTPMNQIMGTGFLLSREVTTEREKNLLSKNQQAARNLLNLLDAILTYAQVESERIRLESIEFDLAPLVEQSLNSIREEAKHKGLELTVEFDPQLPPRLKGDPVRLRQVLVSLLTNAVKFSELGRIVTRIHQVKWRGGEITLRCEVEDQGIGVNPAQLDRLFQLFSQGDDSSTRRHSGAGVGLAMSRRLVALMGGEMGVIPNLEGGSTFWFTARLPVGEAPETSTGATHDWKQVRETAAYLDRLLEEDDWMALILWIESRQALEPLLQGRVLSFDEAMKGYDFGIALRLLRQAVSATPELMR